MQTLSILIPVYNEQAYLERLVDRVVNAWIPDDLKKEIVIVNDASTDNTANVISRLCQKYPAIKAFDQPANAGKGAAIRRAIEEMNGDYAIIQDADLEYDPNEYHIVLRPLLEGRADVVYGSRFATREMRKVLFFHHKLGNAFLTFCSNLTTGLDLTDMETCYKAFRGQVLKSIPLRSNRFGIEPEITAKIAKRGLSVYEVPISYHGRKYDEGKKIGWKDGFSALWTILKYWFLDDYTKEYDAIQVKNSPDNLRRYNRRLIGLALPHLGNRIMELGSQVGLISRQLPQRERLVVSDSRTECVDFLKNHYDGNAVVKVRLFDPDRNEGESNEFDSVLFLHGLQKVENDSVALRNIFGLLRPGGKLILAVPLKKKLFCDLDKSYGYKRRYEVTEIQNLLKEAGFNIVSCQKIHFASYLAWRLLGGLRKRNRIGKVGLKILNMLTLIPDFVPLPKGNLFIVAEKKPV